MITYNHEPYIAQAIEGVLMQETDFPVELVIGEDCSTDNTRKICEDYARRFPGRVRLLIRESNLGVARNFADTLNQCSGEFIALCEGDDYWTDIEKLSLQVDFLEENPHFSSSFHRSQIRYEGAGSKDRLTEQIEPDVLDYEGFLQRKGNCIRTETVVFRKSCFSGFPEGSDSLRLSDWVLHLLLAKVGPIKYIDRVMSVYRIHPGGVWSSARSVDNCLDYAEAVNFCRKVFANDSQHLFYQFMAFLYADAAFFSFDAGDYTRFSEIYKKNYATFSYLPGSTFRSLKLRRFLFTFPFLASVFRFLHRRLIGFDGRHPELGIKDA